MTSSLKYGSNFLFINIRNYLEEIQKEAYILVQCITEKLLSSL